MNFGRNTIKVISEILETTNHITLLDISKNAIGDKGIKILSEVLPNTRSLVHLNVSSVMISHKGADFIFSKLV